MFDINRGEIRKRIYAAIEWLSKAGASLSGAVAILTGVIVQFGELGVDFPADVVMWSGAISAVVLAVNGQVAKMAGARVAIADAVDTILEPFDSTPED